MNTGWIVLIITLVIIAASAAALYFLGRKAKKRQEEQQQQIDGPPLDDLLGLPDGIHRPFRSGWFPLGSGLPWRSMLVPPASSSGKRSRW